MNNGEMKEKELIEKEDYKVSETIKDILDSDVTKALQVNEELQTLKAAEREINEKKRSVATEDSLEKLEDKVSAYTSEQLKKMTDEEILSVFVDDDGNEIEISLPNLNDKEIIEFKRDYLVFLAESKELDKSIAESQKELEEANKELLESNKDIIGEFTNLSNYLESSIKKKLEDENLDDKTRKRLETILKSYDVSAFIDKVINQYQGARTIDNTMREYLDINQHRSRYAKYRMVSEGKLKMSVDLSRYGKLEEKFLPEKYHKHPNLFIFVIMRYISYAYEPKMENEGVSISTLSIKIQNLLGNRLTEEEKEEFLNKMMELLDLFY